MPSSRDRAPGRGNSYLARIEEDYAYLSDPANRSDPFDRLKFIPLDPGVDGYLTLNGETRFRLDSTDHRNFALPTGGIAAAKPGGAPSFTPPPGSSTNQLYKQRYELGADLHLGPNLRFYGELYHGQQTGHAVGPSVPGSLRDDLGLVNGFGEAYDVAGGVKTGARAGRQEVFLGNDLQVRANVSTNLPSPVFDGVRAYRDWGNTRVDVFGFNLVNFSNGVLDDRDINHVNLWGVYGSYDLPKAVFEGIDATGTVDLFYLGWRATPSAVGNGGGLYDDVALLTAAARGRGDRRRVS